MTFIDNRRVGRMDNICPHLVNDSDQRFPDEFQLHKIFHDIPIRSKTVLFDTVCVAPDLLDSNIILH